MLQIPGCKVKGGWSQDKYKNELLKLKRETNRYNQPRYV